ncbi:hypothetical protein Ami103574_03985 [Aminipila butyrica]|uniref:Uncharacterized protein n=1 Tax=Aminipila butyrica TaxID=433296 RepID=A0A858BUA9_9FIRM|nr:hypothetical protein [Aminipila butyrica]QIB68530.1 hypothetical protein Ami103574_03985 [Aminipila butyrica]
MKRLKFKGRKHAVTAICLLVGMFVLTSAVYANYDDARGYTNYKDAVKDLAFYEDNFAGNMKMDIAVDGETYASMKGDFKIDGKDYFWSTSSEEAGESDSKFENTTTVRDGVSYYYLPESNSYRVTEEEGNFRVDTSDPTVKKSIRFAELFADAMVGNLKNNFVLESKEGDERHYSVDVSGNQIPEVINAGISLMFTTVNNQSMTEDPYQITFEDYQKSLAAYYKEQTGEEMTQAAYDQWDSKIEKIDTDFYDKYSKILDAKGGGIVYVKIDGSYELYKTYDAYYKAVDENSLNERDMMRMLGDDPYIDSASCDFTLDKSGKLTENIMKVSMTGVDSKGKTHTITLTFSAEITDYGNAQVEPFDPTGKTKMN